MTGLRINANRNHRYYAVLSTANHGVLIEWWRLPRTGAKVASRIYYETMDIPFHVACDAMHAAMQQVNPED